MIWLLFQAAAITLVVTEGSIFARLRTFGPSLWRQLISCSLCLGVWVGMAMYAANIAWTYPVMFKWPEAVEMLGFGCMAGVLAFLVSMFIACLDRWSGPEPS